MRASRCRFVLGIILVIGLLLGCWFLLPAGKGPPPPLPFDASSYVSTTVPTFGPPANPSLRDRIGFAWLKWLYKRREEHPDPGAYTFGATPITRSSIHGLLNQCMEVSGNRYLLPLPVAGGGVQFGHTNTLNGGQWVAAFENALQTGTVEWWDPDKQAMNHENLVMLRFPAQKTVLVLPKTAAAEFLRTNKTDTVVK
jgi:hypothetical protein